MWKIGIVLIIYPAAGQRSRELKPWRNDRLGLRYSYCRPLVRSTDTTCWTRQLKSGACRSRCAYHCTPYWVSCGLRLHILIDLSPITAGVTQGLRTLSYLFSTNANQLDLSLDKSYVTASLFFCVRPSAAFMLFALARIWVSGPYGHKVA